MTNEEAKVVFEAWKEYIEIADKFRQLMITPPPSFLPYPIAVLEESLNVIAKQYFDAGECGQAKAIQDTMVAYLGGYFIEQDRKTYTDEEALRNMHQTLGLILSDASLTRAVLTKLRDCQESWIKTRR